MPSVTVAHLGLFVSAMIVGASFPIVGLLSEAIPPLLATSARFLIATAAVMGLAGRARFELPTPRALALYAVQGVALAGFFGTMFWAAGRVGALAMASIYVAVPLVAYLLGRLLRVERAVPSLLAALVTGAAGALALVWVRDDGAGSFRFGLDEVWYSLGCCACALYPVLSRWGLEKGWLPASAAVRTAWSLAAGALLIGSAGLLVESPRSLLVLGTSDWLIVGYLGVVSSGATFWLMQRASEVLTPAAVTAYTYLTPFVSVAVLIIEEPSLLGWQWLPGSLLVLAALMLLVRRA
ncbi:MAG: EamA family transporter [Gammaproteobacteria bacterium]|nr:EamA family transporter [Gammaproteobacteria bacterium]|tara:strand:+ start:6515 stop:7399 length:885 start_codon:yes stop_codon:yes gene_type:complete